MNVLGLIPARGGSKGLPGKNLAPLCGRPLIAYTCEAALASRRLTRVIVSTDDARIADVARAHGVAAPFVRPADIASDEASMRDVARHAVEWMRGAGEAVDAVVILQPTSPLRGAPHIDAAIDLLERSGADTVVSVVKVPHQFVPSSLMAREGERLVPLDASSGFRRQDKPVLYARNGPAVLALRVAALDGDSFYSGEVRAIEMTGAESIDIDSSDDLIFAEALLRRTGIGC